MFTPPNQPSSSTSRRRPLPSRSSLSNSFSFAQTPNPQHPPAWDESEFDLDLDTSSVSFAHVRRRLSISEQGNRGIGQVSPRLRPGTPVRGSSSTRTVTQPPLPRVRSRLGHGHPNATPDVGYSEKEISLGEDHVMGEEESDEDEEEVTWNMIDSMRLWRNDAIMQHLYETAAFWGDKILSWTGKLLLSLPFGI